MAEQAKREGIAQQSRQAVLPAPVLPAPSHSGDDKTALLQLLAIEAEAREAKNQDELVALIANEGRKLTRSRQIFVLRYNRTDFVVAAVSGLATVDRPQIVCLQRTGLHRTSV